MSLRTLLISIGLLGVVCGDVGAQPGATTPYPPGVQLPGSTPITQPGAIPATPPEKTLDELLSELERLQAQKADLEKRQQAVEAALRKKLEKQSERLQRLGVSGKLTKSTDPDRVGRIVIEGNTRTPDAKILEHVQLRPGQVLDPAQLEKARDKLEKAGLHGVAIEVLPNELDSIFKDIRVRVNESPARP